jgi:hypothetical protein
MVPGEHDDQDPAAVGEQRGQPGDGLPPGGHVVDGLLDDDRVERAGRREPDVPGGDVLGPREQRLQAG